MKDRLIILDAGHGGMEYDYLTKGKRSPEIREGVVFYEGVFNRMIVNMIQFQLMMEGVPCTILAPENKDISLPTRVLRCEKLAKKYNCFGVSVHSNAYETNGENIFNDKAHGWEIWTSEGHTISDDYAVYFMDEISSRFPESRMRMGIGGKVSKDKNYYILSRTTPPFLLTENWFMTNMSEINNILTNTDSILKIVDAHVAAIKCVYENMI